MDVFKINNNCVEDFFNQNYQRVWSLLPKETSHTVEKYTKSTTPEKLQEIVDTILTEREFPKDTLDYDVSVYWGRRKSGMKYTSWREADSLKTIKVVVSHGAIENYAISFASAQKKGLPSIPVREVLLLPNYYYVNMEFSDNFVVTASSNPSFKVDKRSYLRYRGYLRMTIVINLKLKITEEEFTKMLERADPKIANAMKKLDEMKSDDNIEVDKLSELLSSGVSTYEGEIVE